MPLEGPSAHARPRPHAVGRWLAAAGALLAAAAVALAAYAAHGVEGAAQARLYTAAVFGFGHGLALAALATDASSRLALAALAVLLAGTLLFAGGVTASTLLGSGGRVAPLGGALLVGGWLACAISMLRG